MGFWVFIAFLTVLSIKPARSAMHQVLRAASNWKLGVFFGSFALWAYLLAWLYKQCGLWGEDQIFSTMFWTVLNGFPLLGRSLNAAEDDRFFSKILRDNFKLTGLFEFVVVAYSFSLFAELFVVPAGAFLGMLLGIAQTDIKYRAVQRILELVLAAFVLYILFLSISEIADQPENFWNLETGRNFVLPIIFSIGSIPLIYVWFCISHLENASIRINLKTVQSVELKAYARRRFFLVFMLKPWLLKRAVRQFNALPPAMEKVDVDRIIMDICKYEREAKVPPLVDEAKGWSPYLAREFLTSVGLRTNDFHDSGHNGEWYSVSPYVDLDKEPLHNRVVLYLEGREDMVERVKLTGKFLGKFETKEAHDRLREIEHLLAEKAMNQTKEDVAKNLPDRHEYSVQSGTTCIERRIERYPNDRRYETIFTLTRGQDEGDTD